LIRRERVASSCRAEAEEEMGEAHLPAQQSQARQKPWLSPSDVDARRAGNHRRPSAQGPSPSVGLIWRVRDRATFDELRQHGRRARSGPVVVTYVPRDAGPPRVAFVVGRHVGGAVVRNRLRRRMRTVMRALAPTLTSGVYLVQSRADAVQLSFGDLERHIRSAIDRLEVSR
jgi:ribonuclease P protein component